MVEITEKLTVVYDIEILLNYFCYSDIEIRTGKVNSFEVYDEQSNDFKALMIHLRRLKCQVGYNNVNFDYPILHFLFEHEKFLERLSADALIRQIYDFTQQLIQRMNNRETRFSTPIAEWNVKIPQVDLYRIHHFDNIARRTSLKDLEIAMNWHRVQDMPYSFDMAVSRTESLDIKEYNVNDILATFEFFKKSQSEIKLRIDLSQEYKLNLTNANDPKLGSEIFCKIIAEAKNIPIRELKKMRTIRDSIKLKDCILPNIGFDNPEFNELLKYFKGITIKQTRKAFEKQVEYKGFIYVYGTGGIHGCIKPGVYGAREGEIILDIDVASFYPNLAVTNGFFPEHLGEEFYKLCKDLFEKRKLIPKGDVRNLAYKLMLNGVYGKSNDEYSFLYDPKYTMQITVNGQLLLTMLCERLQDLGCEVLQANTDGVTIRCSEELENKVMIICEQWMEFTKLKLEYAYYKKMVIRDCNNYIGIYSDQKKAPKYKGAFEIKKLWHKDSSFTIVPFAISEYFIKGIPVEATIDNCKDIFMFTGRHKTNKGCYSYTQDAYTGETEKQQKTTRYYIARGTNKSYYRKYIDSKKKGSVEAINSGYFVQIYNVHKEVPFEDYRINKQFYIDECNKIIDVVEPRSIQLQLIL